MKRLDLNLMRVLDALLQTRSVSRAAEGLGVGQPAVSASLSRLRSLLGDPLLVRGRTGYELTSRAQEIQAPLATALASLRDLVEGAPAFDPLTSTRVFHLAGGDYVGMVVLPRLFAVLEREAPNVSLRLRFVEKDRLLPLLEDDTLDLALAVLPGPPAYIRSEIAFTEEFVCATRHDHPLMRGKMTVERFAAERHLLLTERGDDAGAVDEALGEFGLRRRVTATVPLVSLVPGILASTDLVTTVGRRAASRMTADGTVQCAPLPFAMPEWRMQVLSARRRDGDAGIAWLRDRMIAVAAQ